MLLALSLPLAGCVSVPEASLQKSSPRTVKATWYGIGDGSGKFTASGERFNPHGLTVAHKTMRFGTKLHLTNPKTGRAVPVRVNDRGPFVKGIELDLTYGAARAIGMTGAQHVTMEVLN